MPRTTMAGGGRSFRFGSAWLRLFERFTADRSASYALIGALVLPIITGVAGLGTEAALLLYNHKTMQHAADSAAMSAATASSNGMAQTKLLTQAKAVASTYGFTDGASGVTVTLNQPPLSGANTTNPNAIEVIISQPQNRLFSATWASSAVIPASARAVAISNGGPGCVFALDPTSSGAISEQGSVGVSLTGCNLYDDSSSSSALSIGGSATLSANFVGVVGGASGTANITAPNGIATNYRSISDPYANVAYPPYSGCDSTNFSTHGSITINPGVYCGGMNLGAGANVTLSCPNPPNCVYYLDGGSLTMNGSSTLTGNGVTLVFTSSTGSGYATAKLVGGAAINITPPLTGPLAGIAIFGDRSMPVGTSFSFGGGSAQAITGAVYLPKAAVSWAGGSATTSCTQLVGDTISFVGNSGLTLQPPGCAGTKPIGLAGSPLVE